MPTAPGFAWLADRGPSGGPTVLSAGRVDACWREPAGHRRRPERIRPGPGAGVPPSAEERTKYAMGEGTHLSVPDTGPAGGPQLGPLKAERARPSS